MKTFVITEDDLKRYNLFKRVQMKELKLKEACNLLGVSYRHSIRLYKNFKQKGLDGLIKKYNNHLKNKKVTDLIIKQICDLKKHIYFDFNLTHFCEKLIELHKIKFSDETIRQILIHNNIHIPKKRRKIYRRRRRMPKAGLLIQMDSSYHEWIKGKKKWYLIATIDDATNEVMAACFYPYDTTYANMSVIRDLIEKKGLFEALYVDKASHFVTTRHKGLHQDIDDQQNETNIQQALKELNITLITANSPQAKGRIERLFRFFQDRLIKEMKLKKITNYTKANEYLIKEFLPWYNKRYTYKAEEVYKPLPNNQDLNLIFTIRQLKKVHKDNTININGEVIQIPKNKLTLAYIKAYVEVRIREDKTAYILYKNKIILITKLTKLIKETMIEKRERILSDKIIA